MLFFNQGDHIFVTVSNAMIYKTVVLDIRVTKNGVEYYVLNNSFDYPQHRWVPQHKCISLSDIDTLKNLDNINKVHV